MMLQSGCVLSSEEPQTCRHSSGPAATPGTSTGEQGQRHPQNQLLAPEAWSSLAHTLCLQLPVPVILAEMSRLR